MENYMNEAFKALTILNEETFNITNNDIAELKAFTDNDAKIPETEFIIDPLAETEEELQDSYMGKVILDCNICHSLIYKDPSDIIINETEEFANESEECPYCHSVDGYKVVGQVTEFKPEAEKEPKDEVEEDEIKTNEVEEPEEVEEDTSTENLDEAKKSGMSNWDKIQKVLNKSTHIREDVNVNITSNDENTNVNVTSENNEANINIEANTSGEEMIEPLNPETESEFKKDVNDDELLDVDFDEFDEEKFDDLEEKYLKETYENVKSYKTTAGSINGNQLKLEGLITFKSGKAAKTNFVFEAKTATKTGKLKFLGENKQFAKNKNAYTLTGKADGNKLVLESLTYNYLAKDNKTNKATRLYGTVR